MELGNEGLNKILGIMHSARLTNLCVFVGDKISLIADTDDGPDLLLELEPEEFEQLTAHEILAKAGLTLR